MPKRKYYVMLVDPAHGEMRVPVKANQNPYKAWLPFYCAGMPQFFGGTDDGGQGPVDVLARELNEESRQTLELTPNSPNGAPPDLFHTGYDHLQNQMDFYWAGANGWRATMVSWSQGGGAAQREMDRIVAVNLTMFDVSMSDKQLIKELLRQTGGGGVALKAARAEFKKSETRAAFVGLLRKWVSGSLTP